MGEYMKYKYIIGTILFFFLGILPVYAYDFELKSTHALLIQLDEQQVLYEQNAKEPTSIASLTKIMTSIITLENINSLDETVTLTNDDFKGLAEANAAVAGFYVGERVTYRDLLYGLLLPSGADAAQALTRLVAGGRANFVAKMNEKATELGMTNTHFRNETGLDTDNHYSSLEDVAKLFQYALQNPDFKEIISSRSYKLSDGSRTLQSTVWKNLSKNNISMDYLIGGKTGTTENAGLCLASIASYHGVNYMLITTGAPQVKNNPYNFTDAKNIYDYFMENFSVQELIAKDEPILTLNTLYAKEENITFQMPESISKYVSNDFQKENLKLEYLGEQTIPFDTPTNTKLGVLKIILDGEVLASIDITLKESLHFHLGKYLEANPIIILISLLAILFMLLILKTILKRSRKKYR